MNKIIAANWKNNGNKNLIKKYFNYLLKNININNNNKIIFFPPDIYIDYFYNFIKEQNFYIGGQDLVCNSDNATLTGGTKSEMFVDNCCDYILVGHSEKRKYESGILDDKNISYKLKNINNLKVVFCIGEEISDRENNNTNNILSSQLNDLILNYNNHNKIIIAYEPVWAIGTGKIPSNTEISKTHEFIKNFIIEKLPSLKEKDIMVLYGGSVNSKNASTILKLDHVDGVLVGGASLDAIEFTKICNIEL